jgi:hypothetical protein
MTHLTADAILRQIEAMGYATSAHRIARRAASPCP